MNPHNAAAIDLARQYLDSKPGDRATIGAEREAAQRALDETPGCTWSVDQLRARAFNPTCEGMFWSMGRPVSGGCSVCGGLEECGRCDRGPGR